MLRKVKPTHDSSLIDEAIANAIRQLDVYPANSEEYNKTIVQIERLYALRYTNTQPRVSPDTLAIVLGNLFGIAIIVGHERAHVVTSKAMSFVMKAAR